jgi:hypothetical protein
MLHCYITLQVDPELVESHFLRPADQTIRQADIPERLQLLGKSVLEVRQMHTNHAWFVPVIERLSQHLV